MNFSNGLPGKIAGLQVTGTGQTGSSLLPQTMDQNRKYSKDYFSNNMGGIDFVPNITPAYNWNILQPTTVNPNYPRTDAYKVYKQ